MLAIEQTPLYKNKLLIGIAAVIIGFVLTFVLIRGFDQTNRPSATDAETSTVSPPNRIDKTSSSTSSDSEPSNKDAGSTTNDPSMSSDTSDAPVYSPEATPGTSPSSSGTAPASSKDSDASARPTSREDENEPDVCVQILTDKLCI